MSNEVRKQKINVRDWIVLSTVMMGAVLTILALIWQAPPTDGIVTSTFLLMVSFLFFVNSVSANSKAQFEANQANVSETRINRFVTFAEYSFGCGFTLVITGFTILGYEYLKMYTSHELTALILPITFLVVTWAIIFIYNIINYAGKPLGAIRNLKRNLWILLELICLIIIICDFFGILVIP
jgi:hypothetical protein